MGAFDDLIPTESKADNPFMDLVPKSDAVDLSADMPLNLVQPRMPLRPEELTTYGGPPKQLASMRETLAEPMEDLFRPRIQGPPVPLPSEVPTTLFEKAIFRPTLMGQLLGDDLSATVARQSLNAAKGAGEFMTSPVGLGAVVAGAVAPATTAIGFTLDMAKNLGNQGIELWNKWDSLTPEQRAASLTDMGATGAMLVAAGAHAKNRLRTIADEGKPTVIPEAPKEVPKEEPEPTPITPIEKPITDVTETPKSASEIAPETTAPEVAQIDPLIRAGPGASVAADVGAESAAPAAVLRTAEFIDEASKAPTKEVPSAIPEADLRSADPVVEQRWQDAKIAKRGIIDRAREKLTATKSAMTRHFRHLDPKTDGMEADILRVHENVPLRSKFEASQVLRGITAGMDPKKYNVFSRVVILRDLVKYAERFGGDIAELPFGYKSVDAIKNDLAKFEAVADRVPDIRAAVNRRNEFMDALRYDLVSRGLLPEQVKDFGEYFHHQVLEHMAMKDSAPASDGGGDVRTHQKGWQRKRVGSAKDFNTSYLESEFEVIAQSLAQIATQETQKKLMSVADITPRLKATAEAARKEGQDVTWEDLVPEGYTFWQPKEGNVFYTAKTISEKALESYLRGERALTEADIREVLAMGGPKPRWVIPERLAKTLDEMTPQQDHAVEKFIGAGISQWKRWTLFNPMRNVIYELNNLSGDADISFAVDPKIFKHAPSAAKDVANFVRGKAVTPEIRDMVKYDVLDSGFSVKELPDLKGNQFFRALEGKDPSLIQRYWENVLDFNRWREGVLRVSAYRRALELLDEGKKPYWASKKPEMDALYNSPAATREQIAAKLAREAIGDYGNISHAGQWIRSKLIPFYSWMEINAPRYVRLFQNAKEEGGSRGRVAGAVAKQVGGKAVAKTAGLAARAGAFYIMANIWNKTFFPDEERELADTKDQFHLILGRNDDGSVRSIRLQGAFSDALSWFGAENVAKDIHDVQVGTASVGDKVEQAAKAPLNKVAQGLQPIYKTVFETAAKRTLYPDVLNPRPIRDRGAHVAQLFSGKTIYDYLTNKPQRPGTWGLMALASYTTDPGESAYNTARSIIADKMKDLGEERAMTDPTDRSNALYYYKQAIKYKDDKLKDYWFQKYKELGGTDKGLKESVKRSAPFGGIAEDNRRRVNAALSPAEKEIIARAEQWYKKTYRP